MKPRLIILILALALVGSLWFGYGQKKRADGLANELQEKEAQAQQALMRAEEQRNIAMQEMMKAAVAQQAAADKIVEANKLKK